MTIVYTGGTFDLLHAGHIDFLHVCKKIAGTDGKVVVALNTDDFVAQFKGKAPVCTFTEREAVLLACKYVDLVVENVGGADSKPAIEYVGKMYRPIGPGYPDFIVIGEDWANRDYCKQMSFTPGWLWQHDISLIYVPRHRDLSSTQIKERSR